MKRIRVTPSLVRDCALLSSAMAHLFAMRVRHPGDARIAIEEVVQALGLRGRVEQVSSRLCQLTEMVATGLWDSRGGINVFGPAREQAIHEHYADLWALTHAMLVNDELIRVQA